jgi:formylglycine-generating enzyme required for sulfatase activity
VLPCHEGMISICGSFCIDEYEASRPDATEHEAGIDESMATSRPGVVPWQSGTLTPAEAAVACEAAGKRLCEPQEWELACGGVEQLRYTYGDDFDAGICNGIDAWCDEDCGVYQDCYRDCDADYQLSPTGAFPACDNGLGVMDLSGNTWEAVVSSDGVDHFRGGAYNCGDPGLAHRCSYDGVAAGTFPSVRGFRCCADGEPSR